MTAVCAYAHTNIALIKYWGKRDVSLNLPATGSLSLTLDRFGTRTELLPAPGDEDLFELDGEPAAPAEQQRVSRFLDLVRAEAKSTQRVLVRSRNDVPTAAGLASSASAFAALTVAADAFFETGLDPQALSALARRGSGSAARSIFGGFCEMRPGTRADGTDAHALPITCPPGFDVRLVVVRCAAGRKKVGSTEGMLRTAETSPFYAAWIDSHQADLRAAKDAIARADIDALGSAMEHSTLKMHASALGARPGLWYFLPTSIAVLNRVRALADAGASVYFTMDAGPHVKVLCLADEAAEIAETLGAIEGVRGVEICGPGPAARLVEARA